jgi:hypothetical protein
LVGVSAGLTIIRAFLVPRIFLAIDLHGDGVSSVMLRAAISSSTTTDALHLIDALGIEHFGHRTFRPGERHCQEQLSQER